MTGSSSSREVLLASCACEAQVDLILNLESRLNQIAGDIYDGFEGSNFAPGGGLYSRDNFEQTAGTVEFQKDVWLNGEKALKLKPDSETALVGLGKTFVEKGDEKNARASFDAAIKLNPKDALAYYDRGVVRYEREEFDAAFVIATNSSGLRLAPPTSAPPTSSAARLAFSVGSRYRTIRQLSGTGRSFHSI